MIQNERKQEILTYIDSQLSGFPEGENSLEVWYEWREACLMAINDGSSLHGILDASKKILAGPVAILDNALNIIAYSDAFSVDLAGTIWEYLLSSDHSSAEIFTPRERGLISEWLGSAQESLHFFSEEYPGNEIVMIRCRDGMVCFTDLNGPISEGEQYFVEELAHFLESAMGYAGNVFAGRSDAFYIERLLRGMNVRQTVLTRQLRARGWSTEGKFCVYTVSEDASDLSVGNDWFQRLNERFQQMIILTYEDMTVMISCDPGQDEQRKLRNTAEQFRLKIGCSSEFHQFRNLHTAYIQGQIANSYARQCQMVLYDDIYMDHCLKSLKKMTEVKALCYPKLMELKESGDRAAGELIHDLRVYLMLGCDIAETARHMNLHRNTLLYRLQKLEGILGVSLKKTDADVRFYLLISTLMIDSGMA